MVTEVRCALALNGGVSLAVWIGGLSDELLRLANAGEGRDDAVPEYVELCRELGVRPVFDVIAGTSAGGLNGAFLALGLVNGCRDLAPLRDLWIDKGAFSELLRSPEDADLPSLLKGESWFLPRIVEALDLTARSGTGVRPMDPPLDVRLTATALAGRMLTIADGPASISTLDHRVEFRFDDADFDLGSSPDATLRLARALRSTSSFPGAFEPSPVEAGFFTGRQLSTGPGAGHDYIVDGGVLVNLPAANAIEAIVNQPSRERVERVLALVVPDPMGAPEAATGPPDFLTAVGKSAVGIPRNQSLSDFVDDVREHNQEVLGRRAARSAFLGQLADVEPALAWTTMVQVSDALFGAYRAARQRSSLHRIETRRAGRIEAMSLGADAPIVGSDQALLPWVPHEMTPGGDDWGWGGRPIRRLAALLITWANVAAAGASAAGDRVAERELFEQKEEVSRVRAQVDRVVPVGIIDWLLDEELAVEGTSASDALARAAARWAHEGDRPGVLRELLGRLGGALHAIVELSRPLVTSIADADEAAILAGVVNAHDGADEDQLVHLLLAVEVIEVAFAGSEPRPDQTIRIAQFSALQAVTIDPLGRDGPDEKLAGVQLGHFAAFLKRSWRANDWMWGRLDAAERMVRLLDQVTGGRLEREGRLEYHLLAVQSAILRDMLPLVASKVADDAESGANVAPEALAFVGAVADAGTIEDVSTEDLAELLAANRLGQERLHHEAGSRQSASLALTAAATGLALVHRTGPRGLRGPARVLANTATVVWRVQRMTRTRQLLLLGAVIAVAVLAGVVVVADLAGADVGLWIIPASMVFGLALLVLVVRTLPVLRWVAGRASRADAEATDPP